MSLGERIEERLTAKGWSQAQLARRIGVQSTSIWKLVEGQSKGSKYLHDIARELETTTAYLTGETDNPAPTGMADRRLGYGAPPADRSGDIVEIDQIDLRYGLGATYTDVPIETQKRVFSRSWLRLFTHSSPEHLFWTAGDGDSMEPTIRSGEIVLIDTAQKTPRMSGGIWAVAMGEIGMIKRLHVPGRDRLELLSDSGREPPIVPVPDDQLEIIGRVVAVVRRL